MDFEIIDNLESDDKYNPLSARQGKVLKGLIDDLQAQVDDVITTAEIDTLFDV